MARILIVDDEVQIREMLQKMLERAGYEIMVAADGIEATKLLHEEPIDLVITDLIMPEKEGINVIMELRRDFPNVKIIAISGGGRVDPTNYLLTAKMLGAHQIFTKPFARKEMLAALKELLDCV